MRTLKIRGIPALGIDLKASTFTTRVGSIVDRGFVREVMAGIKTVFHTATLHKPHVGTHSQADFLDVNLRGTLNLLEEAATHEVQSFVFTSTTSVFGQALRPLPEEPAAWVTEDLRPIPRNIYGVTKAAAEDLCFLAARKQHLPCVVLRTSRFFPEIDDDPLRRAAFSDENLKVNEFLYRRADLADIVEAHLAAARKAPEIGFEKFIISAPTPFRAEDVSSLRQRAPEVLKLRVPAFTAIYAGRGWVPPQEIDRVYVSDRAQCELGWEPIYTFEHILERLRDGKDFRSPLARAVGSKGYHETVFDDGPYPVRD